MKLAFDLSFTHTEGRWAAPGSWVGARYPDLSMFTELARTAERGGVDMIFFGDGAGIPDTWRGSYEDAVRWGVQWPRQDMSPIIAALAQSTSHIGFGLTYSSTYMHPFYVARLLNSLDHVTGGRIALNVVASGRVSDAANYGYSELPPHDERYERMEEFVEVCRRLWASVEDGAVVANRETGVFGDPSKVHRIDHRGQHFSVRGPLPSVPGPQRRPVLVQAGMSPRGIEASAAFADVVFGVGGDLEWQRRHRAALDAALAQRGRDPADVGILWSVQIVVAETPGEATARREALLGGLSREGVGTYLSYNSAFDFSVLPKSFVLGELQQQILAAQAGQVGFVAQMIERHGADARIGRDEFFDAGWRHATGYDHTVVGDAAGVVDELERWYEAGGSRGGFMVTNPVSTPSSLNNVVHLVVPEMRRRGLRSDGEPAATLAQNLLGRAVGF